MHCFSICGGQRQFNMPGFLLSYTTKQTVNDTGIGNSFLGFIVLNKS